jgi:hypothetical protein
MNTGKAVVARNRDFHGAFTVRTNAFLCSEAFMQHRVRRIPPARQRDVSTVRGRTFSRADKKGETGREAVQERPLTDRANLAVAEQTGQRERP